MARRSSSKEARGRPIVIADDDPLTTRLIRALLERLNRPVLVAQDGDDVLRQVRKNVPDLLVLDVHMPRRGGLEVLRVLRNDPRTQRLPILVLTTLSQPEIAERALSAGADAFLAKPIDCDALLKEAHALLCEGHP